MDSKVSLNELVSKHHALGIDSQVDYPKIHLYAIIAHSTAIEGSTITVQENQVLLDEGTTIPGRTLAEQMMNLDLKEAYDHAIAIARTDAAVTRQDVIALAAAVMRRTGRTYNTALGTFDSAKGDLRKVNVTAGYGGKSYPSFNKVERLFDNFCAWLQEVSSEPFAGKTPEEIYRLSFEAHFWLVSIHPWVDGNGRMSRLVMNMLQYRGGLVPTILLKEDKTEYIKALNESQEKDSPETFVNYMFKIQERNLRHEIVNYLKTTEKEPAPKKKTFKKSKGKRH